MREGDEERETETVGDRERKLKIPQRTAQHSV